MERKNEKAKRRINNKSFFSPRSLAFIALSVAFLCVLSPISIPLFSIPVSLATFAVFLVSAVCGGVRGGLAVVTYILLGLIGLPVFSGFSAGVGVLFSVSGGYLIGYIPCSLLNGFLIEAFPQKKLVYPLAMLCGLSVCYALGVTWLFFSTNVGFGQALLVGVLPFVTFDCVKIVAASLLSFAVKRALNRVDG